MKQFEERFAQNDLQQMSIVFDPLSAMALFNLSTSCSHAATLQRIGAIAILRACECLVWRFAIMGCRPRWRLDENGLVAGLVSIARLAPQRRRRQSGFAAAPKTTPNGR